jgi:CheY-like chemotaxis protein
MSQQPPRPLRVLVVEDDQDTCESLCLLVRLWGHAGEAAPSGAAAVRAAASFRPGVVLMDIGLPGMDGWEASRRMRKLPDLSGAAFVALSAYGREADVGRSRAEGFVTHLVKPVDPELLRDLLAQLAADCAAPAK